MSTKPLEGRWSVTSSANRAQNDLPLNSKITITYDGTYHFTVDRPSGSVSWTVKRATPDDLVIAGDTENGGSGFVVTEGPSTPTSRTIVGMNYPKGSGDGEDPGTWEADESGSGG